MKNSPTKLLKFSKVCWGVVCRGIRPFSSKFSKKIYTRQQHALLLMLKKRLRCTYREVCDYVAEMPRICELIRLQNVPHFTTLQKAFSRFGKYVMTKLLELSVGETTGFVGIDSTGFRITNASPHYVRRCGLKAPHVKTSISIDTETQMVLSAFTCHTRKHDSQFLIPLAESSGEVNVLVADKGYDSQPMREELRSKGIRPLILHREFTGHDKRANETIRRNGYHERSKVESVFFVVKQKFGDVLSSKTTANQHKEGILTMVTYNIYRKTSQIIIGFLQGQPLSSKQLVILF